MKLAIGFILLFLSVHVYADVLRDCERLEFRHNDLIDLQRTFSLCTYHLGKSRENYTSACDSIAIGRILAARESLDAAIIYLTSASSKDEKCDSRTLIGFLLDDTIKFKKRVK